MLSGDPRSLPEGPLGGTRSRPHSWLAFLSHFLPGLPRVTKQINTLTQVPVSGCALGETKMVHLGYIS